MKARFKAATGKINNDGKLSLYMQELNEFFSQHKGSRLIIRFEVAPVGSSAALRGYYYNCVVPSFKQGLYDSGERKTEKDTEIFMRQISPVAISETVCSTTGNYTQELREIASLSNAELIDHIDHLKQIAAEQYGTYIEDPRTI